MKTLLTLPLLLLSLISFPSWSETIDDLILREGLWYKKFSSAPFTGRITGQYQGKFKKGKRHGPWVGYYENGQLQEKGEYKNGKSEGPWVFYNEDGQLLGEGELRNGKEEGPWVSYHHNGQLFSKGEYKNGKQEGRWVAYDYEGNLDTELSGVYKNGVKISD